MTNTILFTLSVALVIASLLYRHLAGKLRREREAFIRGYPFPPQLHEKLATRHPHWQDDQINLVLRALRQYFLVCLEAQAATGRLTIGMPSKAVDDAWHEFILMSRHYTEFCRHAFGRYLHHAPESTLQSGIDDALVNTLQQFKSGGGRLGWTMLGGMPLLFAADRVLGVEDGYHYDTEAMARLEHKRQRRKLARDGGGDAGWSVDFSGCGADGGCGGGCGGCGS